MTSVHNGISLNVRNGKESHFTSALNSPRGLMKARTSNTIQIHAPRSAMERVTMVTSPPMARGSLAPTPMARGSLAPTPMARGSLAAQGFKVEIRPSLHIPLGVLDSSDTSHRDSATSTLIMSQKRRKLSPSVSRDPKSPNRI
jgi:hypothetical protein